jgi:hypothetical protein
MRSLFLLLLVSGAALADDAALARCRGFADAAARLACYDAIPLANGQVWQIADGSARFMSLDNPKVTIRRGALGSFFLDFENDNRSPRVRRVQ